MNHRIALIGAGDIVRKAYLPELTKRNDCRVIALCSQSGTTAQDLAGRYDIPFNCKDYREILNRDDVDEVFVCTPTNSHAKIAEAALTAGKHVLVEKPLCIDYSSSHALLLQAARSERVLYPAFNNDFREENLHFLKKAERGELGSLEAIDFEWFRTRRYESKAWLYDAKQSGGGVLIDLGSHLIHMALGMLPERKQFNVFAINTCHSAQDTAVEDASVGMVIVDDRVSIIIKTGWDVSMPERSRVNLTVIGRQGVASNHDYQGPKSEGYPAMLDDYLKHIEMKIQPDLSIVDDTMLILDALFRSSRKKTCVTGVFKNLETNHLGRSR